MKGTVLALLKKSLKELDFKIQDSELVNLIEIPPNPELGDYAFPCFFMSKTLKTNPHEAAMQLRAKIGNVSPLDFKKVEVSGPYVNFFLNRKSITLQTLSEIVKKKDQYGKTKQEKQNKTMVEFPSQNTNKPLHLGHLRNMAIGESISRILEFSGDKVIRANLNNDRGIHICKSMLAYQKWGKAKTPKSKKMKPDHFVGEFYTMFEKKKNPELEEEVQKMLKKWEAGDKETLNLWKTMNSWALSGFQETYKKFGIKHDVTFFESNIYNEGKEIIMNGVKKGIFSKAKSGEIKIDLEKEGLGEKILLRKDGTSLYIVQDLALAEMKYEKYKLDKSFYIVGNEQDYHFQVLFSILEKLGFKKEMKHISYGMVNLPSGKMKSREGTVVDADDLIEELRVMAEKELKKRSKLSKLQLEKRSLAVALAAIKYMLLKIDIKKSFLFNPKESVSFEGDTGPYLMYSYARAGSILKKSKTRTKNFEIHKLEEKEAELVKKLSQFPDAVSHSYKNLNPSIIANYSFQLAQVFNEFYHACKVIGSEKEDFRLALVRSFRQVLKNSLSLLGIDTIEEM